MGARWDAGCRRSNEVHFIRGQKEGVGRLNHLVCTSSINITAMYDAGHGTWRCSAAFSFSIILFFSLPATTIALNISYSVPTQCSPFQVTWDDSPTEFRLAVLPLNERPVKINVSSYMRNEQTRSFGYTISPLTLKTGTQFVFNLDYGYCAPFISSIAQGTNSVLTRYHSLAYVLLIVVDDEGTFVSSIQTVGDSSDSSCLSTTGRSRADELVLLARHTHTAGMLNPDRVMECYKIPRPAQDPGIDPRWSG